MTSQPSGRNAAVQAAVFTPLDQTGRAEAVARRLADAISLGLLGPGERLPSESELGRHFGVATVTAREALESLRGDGLVDTRRGRGGGSFVRDTAHIGDTAVRRRLLATTRVELRDLGLHYAAITAAASRLAAEFATADEAEALLELIGSVGVPHGAGTRADPAGVARARRAENTIRLETVALSRSVRLVREQVRLQAEFGPLHALLLRDPADARENLDRHRAVAVAIAEVDGAAAHDLVDRHVGWAVERLVALRQQAADS